MVTKVHRPCSQYKTRRNLQRLTTASDKTRKKVMASKKVPRIVCTGYEYSESKSIENASNCSVSLACRQLQCLFQKSQRGQERGHSTPKTIYSTSLNGGFDQFGDSPSPVNAIPTTCLALVTYISKIVLCVSLGFVSSN